MVTKNDLENQREAIQDDLICVLDGLDQEFIDRTCDMIVQRFDILISKLE
jgi:hypothetical protein